MTLFTLSGFNSHHQIHPSLCLGSDPPLWLPCQSLLYQLSIFTLPVWFPSHRYKGKVFRKGRREKEEEKKGKQTQPCTWIWSPDPPMSCWALIQTYGHGFETPPCYLQLWKYNLKHALLKELLYFIYHLLCVLNRSKAILFCCFVLFCKAILDQHDLLHWIEDDTMWAEIKRMGEELSRWSREGRMLQANLRVERSKNREHYGWNREGRGEYGSGWSWRDRKNRPHRT